PPLADDPRPCRALQYHHGGGPDDTPRRCAQRPMSRSRSTGLLRRVDMTLDPTKIGFRPLEPADLPLLHRWLNTDFVKEWYDSGPPYEEVVAKYAPRIAGRAPTRSFVTMYGDTPIGYIQTYRIDDYPEYSRYVRAGEEAAGVDLFIG